MITIYVKSKCDNPTLEYPEHKKIASEYIPEVWKHIQDNKDVHILTCSEHIVEFIGHMIDQGEVSHDEVMLYVEDEIFNYDVDGILLKWRYGYFYRDISDEATYVRDVNTYDEGYKAGFNDGEFAPPTDDHASKKWIDYDRGYGFGKFDAYFSNDPE